MSRRVSSVLTTFALVALLLGSVPVRGAIPPGLSRVSGPSPYAGCVNPGEHGVNFVGAETEPQVASNPADPDNLIGVWQQDRWKNGGSHGVAAGFSFDGGRTWTETTLPFSRCAPGGADFDRASDPWVSIGPDGTAYAVGLALSMTGAQPNAIVTATSEDGGANWDHLRTVKLDTDGIHFFNDKESITADPVIPGVAYVVWDRARPAPSGHFRQPSLFSKTTDWGNTWSTPKPIAAAGLDEASVNNIVVVDPISGAIYNFYSFFYCTCFSVARIEFVKSTDGGTTWSRPHVVDRLDSLGVVNPISGAPERTADFGAQVAIDPGTGALYAAWQSPRFNNGNYDEIALTSSTDGGRTWSPARRGNSFTGQQAFNPTIAVNFEGVVGLTYYDFRRFATSDSGLPTDFWLRSSRDGGATFSADQHVAGPFNFNAAPVSRFRGHFIGDYMGLAADFKTFVPFFVQTNCSTGVCPGNRTDVYAARFEPLPAESAHATRGALAPTGYSPAGSGHNLGGLPTAR